MGRFSIIFFLQGTLWDRHQIGFFGGVKILRLDLEVQADIDFNIKERKMLYTGFVFIYNYQCLDFRADFKIFYFREKHEWRFLFSFGLGNIGKTVDFLGGMGF